MQCQGPEAKTTEVEASMALICASADDGKPLTGGLNRWWLTGLLQVVGHA